MFHPPPSCEITLVSQLLDSIDGHLKRIRTPMLHPHDVPEEGADDDDDDELWLSGHRSIFSSYGSTPCRKTGPSTSDSRSDGFHWDSYGNSNYHRLAFEYDQQPLSPPAHLSEWSMHLNSDDSTSSLSSGRARTSWRAIRAQSTPSSCSLASTNTSNSGSFSPHSLTLYHLFQCRKSQQHPCRLYQNFSDRSVCDSSLSSSPSTSRQITARKIKLKSPTTTSQLDLINAQQHSKSNVDQCLQTSLALVGRSRTPERLLNHPSSQSSFTSDYLLPDLDFLRYYARENPPPLSTAMSSRQPRRASPPLKGPLTDRLAHRGKHMRAIFYCHVQLPARQFAPAKAKSAKANSSTTSDCSSTSSSGYYSNGSGNHVRHVPTPVSALPLKSCLKRTKAEESSKANVLAVGTAGDVFTLAAGRLPNKADSLERRRNSAPSSALPEDKPAWALSTKNSDANLSEHDLSAKKSVSFCDEIARRLIAPSNSSKARRQDLGDLLPRESLTDSPPSEFNLSDEDHDDDDDASPVSFTTNTSDNIIKPLPIKNSGDRHLIDAFAHIVLRILEIKCNDPKSTHLNNQTNPELDRILRLELCPLLREVLEDGLRQHPGSIFARKVNLWRLIESTTPPTSAFHDAKLNAQLDSSTSTDWIERFNCFVYQLLNCHELTAWLTHFVLQRTSLTPYYEPWAFVLVYVNNDLFERISNQLEKLSPLAFRLKYTSLSNSRIVLTNQRLSTSILSRKFNVRSWLRDRKTQVKVSPKDSISTRRLKSSAAPLTKR